MTCLGDKTETRVKPNGFEFKKNIKPPKKKSLLQL